MRFTVLEYGVMTLDSNFMVERDTLETASNPTPVMVNIPIWGVLLQTEGHNIIFDLGCMEQFSEIQKDRFPFVPVEGGIEVQLAKVGLTEEDIDTIIVSHMHFDHFGLITKFPHCDVYVPEEDWNMAMKSVSNSGQTSNGLISPYDFSCITAPVKQYHYVLKGEDFELFHGLRIITLPGHTPNLLGIMATNDSGKKFLFVSDAINTPMNIGPPMRIPGFYHCADECLASMEKVVHLSKEYNAEICYSHYMPYYNTLKKVPEFYK